MYNILGVSDMGEPDGAKYVICGGRITHCYVRVAWKWMLSWSGI